MAIRVFNAKLHGAKELERALRELPKRTGKRAMRKAMERAAEPLKRDMAQNAERAFPELAQAAAASTKLSRRQKRGAKKPGKAEVTYYVGFKPGRLAHLFEFGSGPRYQKNGRYTGQMPALPFARPAWEANKRQVLADFGFYLWQEVEKAAKRLAKKRAKAGK